MNRGDEPQCQDRFLRLFTANEAAIRGFVRSLVPSRQDAADIMQEVAVVLWRKFDKLGDADDFRRWAFGVARYEVLGWRRDKARDRLLFGEEAMEIIAREAAAAAPRLEAQREALEACLGELSEEQRNLVHAAYQPAARIDRLAASMGRTAMALYKTLHRIRLSLIDCTRRHLAREGLV